MLTAAPTTGTQAGNTRIPDGAGSRCFTRSSRAAYTHRLDGHGSNSSSTRKHPAVRQSARLPMT